MIYLARTQNGTHADFMMGSIYQLEHITEQMGQMSFHTSQPTSGQYMQHHANPSLISKKPIV